MRILYLHQYFVTPGSSGGTRSYEFARRLIAAGHTVLVITSSAMLPAHCRNPANKIHTVRDLDGVPAIVIDVSYANDMGFQERGRAFLRFATLASREVLRHKADVVFATSTPLTIVIPAFIAKLRHRIPLVFEVRDLWPELPIAVGALRHPVAKSLARGLEWLAYHVSHHIIALSPGMAEGVLRRGIDARRVTVIPNCCDVELFDVPASRGRRIRESLNGLGPDQPLIVYSGTFGLINGVDYLVDVAAAMRMVAPEIRFLLVGSGAKREEVTAKAKALGVLGQNLWIWDPVPKAAVPDLLAAATVATSLFVSLQPMWNNSANKFFDALAAGKPIAINYGGWQAELLEKSGAGIVLPPGKPLQAAQSLALFARDKARLQRAACAARDLAMTQFNRDLMAQKLEDVLCSAVKG